ncbi:MAG TPA: hypothetical protein VK771_10800 [Acidimicrobiia bacterium]|nr:hypothetical protein [Acidimicrobiia bacterium]
MRKVGRALLAASMALSVGSLAGPAGAAAGPQCAALTTTTVLTKLTASLSKCTPTAATGGAGAGTFTAAAKGAKSGSLAITITWASGHGTSKGNVMFTTAKGLGRCAPTTTSLLAIGGTVIGGSGTAFRTIKKGQRISGAVCVGAKSDTLEPGTVLAI